MASVVPLSHRTDRSPVSPEVLLRRFELFARTAPDTLQRVGRAVSRRHWVEGQLIFTQGDSDAAEVYLVLQGRVRLSMTSAAGRELSLRHVGTGDILGEVAALGDMPRTATATALSNVEALVVPANTLINAVSSDADTARAVMRLLCHRLRATTEQLENVALYGLEARLARFLLGVAGHNKRSVTLPLTQGQMAEMIGASRPKVSQALARLERSGVIIRHGARYALNIELLKALANRVE